MLLRYVWHDTWHMAQHSLLQLLLSSTQLITVLIHAVLQAAHALQASRGQNARLQ